MSISNADKKTYLNNMNSTASRVGLGDLVFGGSAGEISFPAAKTAAYTLTEEDVMIEESANANVTLPLAASVARGKRFEVLFSNAAGGGLVPSGSDTIGGQAGTFTVTEPTRVVVTSDGASNWIL